MVKPISAEGLWSCLKRYIAFEDPVSRWEKLLKLTSKYVPGGSLKQLPLEAQGKVFQSVFSSQVTSQAAALLNVALALEDLARFQTITFDLWLNSSSAAQAGQSLMPYSQLAWVKELGIGDAKAAWVAQAASIVPDWASLNHPGPWLGDVRAEFMAHCLDRLDGHELNFSAQAVLSASAVFQQTLSTWRQKLPGSFMPNLIVLVEGLSEALLLPCLLECLHVDADASGVVILPSGGARQVVRRYLEWRERVCLPILVVMDKDAEHQAEVVRESCRSSDCLYILSAGEIEDIFDKNLLITLVNKHLRSFGLTRPVDHEELERLGRRTAVLDKIWRDRGLGNFDKIGFARTVADFPLRPEHLSQDILAIVTTIKELLGRTSRG